LQRGLLSDFKPRWSQRSHSWDRLVVVAIEFAFGLQARSLFRKFPLGRRQRFLLLTRKNGNSTRTFQPDAIITQSAVLLG